MPDSFSTADPADNLFEAHAEPVVTPDPAAAAPAAAPRPYTWDDEPRPGRSRGDELRETVQDLVARARDGIVFAAAARPRLPRSPLAERDLDDAPRRSPGRFLAPAAVAIVLLSALYLVWPSGEPERPGAGAAGRTATVPPAQRAAPPVGAAARAFAPPTPITRYAGRPEDVVREAPRMAAARPARQRRRAHKARRAPRRRSAPAARVTPVASTPAPVAAAPAPTPTPAPAPAAKPAPKPTPSSSPADNEFSFER